MATNFALNKKKLKTVLQHLLGWVIYILYEEAVVYFGGIGVELLSTFIAFLVNAAVFYNTWKVWRFLIEKIKNIFLLVPVIIIVEAIIITLSVYLKLMGDVIGNHVTLADATNLRISTLIMRAIYFGGMGAAFNFAKELIRKERETMRYKLEKLQLIEQRQKLEKKALQAELNVIKSQINPHFVFNTLGFLYAETYKKLPEVGQAIITLSNIMRYALTKNEDGFNTLESEVNYIKDFIKIHEVRSQAFFMKLTINIGPKPYKIASLLLITLIENMFKHGVLIKVPKKPP